MVNSRATTSAFISFVSMTHTALSCVSLKISTLAGLSRWSNYTGLTLIYLSFINKYIFILFFYFNTIRAVAHYSIIGTTQRHRRRSSVELVKQMNRLMNIVFKLVYRAREKINTVANIISQTTHPSYRVVVFKVAPV